MALSPKQMLILLGIIIRPGGGALQKDLGFKVSPADRGALIAGNYLASAKQGRSLWLEATNQGGDYVAQNLDAPLPPSAATLQAWLTLLKTFLEAKETPLAEMLSLVPPAPPAAEPQSKPKPKRKAKAEAAGASGAKSTRKGKGKAAAPLTDRIRAAYLECTGGATNKRVFLSELRQKLDDVDAAALEGALREMHAKDGAYLSGTDVPAELTAADRAAGLSYKGETMYVLWIAQ